MTTYFLLSFGLISFLFFISFASCFPTNTAYYTSPVIHKYDNVNDDIPKAQTRLQRAFTFYPRASRNAWYRVSTYQHFKPSGSDETPNGDNLMRWGR
jgi:hypothetical protein